jgi:hypothetical protein
VRIDPEEFRRHYASLSDEALLDVDPGDLTEVALKCYDEELAARGLNAPEELEGYDEPGDAESEEIEEDWLAEATCACSFASHPSSPAAGDAGRAREILEANGVPSHVHFEQIDSANQQYQVMVPAGLNLKAVSVLDREIFNPEAEAEWRTHFETMSDDDLGALSAEVLCAGLLDRAKRLKRAYEDEIARRGLQ